MLKAVILVGGPPKGTRFRPLTLDIPKPLFPVAGYPMIQHHIEACLEVRDLREILIIGFYPPTELQQFVDSMVKKYVLPIRYRQEYVSLGTAGGIYHFRDHIRKGDPEEFFVLNGDVCADFCLSELLEAHREAKTKGAIITMMGTDSTRNQSVNYGCIAKSPTDSTVLHFVEKPTTFVSALINCGVYCCSLELLDHLKGVYQRRQTDRTEDNYSALPVEPEHMSLEQDVLSPLAGTGALHVWKSSRWWSQVKTAAAAVYSNRHYLKIYQEKYPERLAKNGTGGPEIVQDVFIDPKATVDPTSKLGPNVSIGPGVTIGAGVRIRDAIVLGSVFIAEHTFISHSIIGWNSSVGMWTRIEGTPNDPNPDKPFAKMDNLPLFSPQGKLNPAITILGCNVQVCREVIILNSIVLPHKDLARSYRNEIIL